MQEGSKSKDRIDLNPVETQYLQRLSLSNCRVYFRYRARRIAMVKMSEKGKKPSESLTCRFCAQEHLEICEGTKFERRGVRVSEVMGRLIFRRSRMQKMTQKTFWPNFWSTLAPACNSAQLELRAKVAPKTNFFLFAVSKHKQD